MARGQEIDREESQATNSYCLDSDKGELTITKQGQKETIILNSAVAARISFLLRGSINLQASDSNTIAEYVSGGENNLLGKNNAGRKSLRQSVREKAMKVKTNGSPEDAAKNLNFPFMCSVVLDGPGAGEQGTQNFAVALGSLEDGTVIGFEHEDELGELRFCEVKDSVKNIVRGDTYYREV